MAEKPDKLVAEARERWNRCDEAENKQRARMLLAKQFRAGDQWPEAIRIAREGGQAITGQPAQPARPCLTIDRLSQPCRQISNTIKSANFAIDVLPNGGGSDRETAEIFKGYLRYVQNRSRGESPVEWAADQAIESGLGWFRIRADYVYESPEGVPEEAVNDQELRLERITNNLAVYCDPWATKPTRADAAFMFVVDDLSREEFKRRYKKTDADTASLDAFAATGNAPKDWVSKDTVRVAEYWRVTYQDVTVGGRVFRRPVVTMDLINAIESLQHFDWLGSRIPLIPVFGEELNVDGRTHLRGIIEEGMGAQRMVNYTYSGAVEMVALASRDAPIVMDDQIADYKNIWETRAIYSHSYWPYKGVSVGGTLAPPPFWPQHEPPIQGLTYMLQVSEEAIKATTGIYDQSLGKENSQAKSGRAIQALQGQSDLGSSNYPDNVRRALIYAGEQMVEIAPKITRKGQLLQILGVDDQPKQVLVGQPFVEQPDGQPQPVPEGQEGQYEKGLVKFYDFSAGRYAVTVAVGKSYTTKREEGAAAIGELMPSLPPMMAAAVAPEFIEELSFPGAHKIAEVARRALPPELQDPKDGEQPIPPMVQQQMQQLAQQVELLTKELEGKTRIIETDVVKAQQRIQELQAKEQSDNARTMADLEIRSQMDTRRIAAEERQSALDNLVKLAIAEINQQTQMANTHAEQVRAEMGFQHEHSEAERDRGVQMTEAERDRSTQVTEADKDRKTQTQEAAEDRAVAVMERTDAQRDS